MAKFKVIALSVGGKGNKIFKSGEIVDSSNFNNAESLVEAGFLQKLEEKKPAPKVEEPKEEVKKPTPKRRKRN